MPPDTLIPPAPARFTCPCGNPVTGRSPHARFCLACTGRLAVCPHCGGKVASEGLPACRRHLEAEIGVTYRQLDHWVRQGYLRPGRRVNHSGTYAGSGVNRVWPAAEVEIVRRIGRLTEAGISPAVAARFARDAWPSVEIGPGIRIEVDDRG